MMYKKVVSVFAALLVVSLLGSWAYYESRPGTQVQFDENATAQEFLEFIGEFSAGDASACTLCLDGTVWGPWCCDDAGMGDPPGCLWQYMNCYGWVEQQATSCDTWFIPAWVYDPVNGGCHLESNYCAC